MTLEFRPPFQIDPNAPTHGERSLANLSNTFNNMGNDWAQHFQQKKQEARQQQMMDIQKAQEARAQASFAPIDSSAWGGESQPGPQGPSPSSNMHYGTNGPYPNTGISPQGQPMSMEQPMDMRPGQDKMPIDHTSHFMNWKNSGMPTSYDHADYGGSGQPQRQNPMAQPGFDPQTFYRLNQPQREAYLSGTKEKREGDFRQSEINKNNAQADMFRRGGPGSDKGTWHQNPYSGEFEWYPTNRPSGGAPNPSMPNPGSPGGAPGGGSQAGQGDGLPAGIKWQDRAKLAKEKPKVTGTLRETLNQYDAMIKLAKQIQTDPSLGSATGMTSFMSRVPASGAARVSANLETLKSKTLNNVLGSLKQLSANGSSGYGALSNVEGEGIKNSVSPLSRNLRKEDLIKSIDSYISQMTKSRQNIIQVYKDNYGEFNEGGNGGGRTYKFTATGENGQKIGSDDGENWEGM